MAKDVGPAGPGHPGPLGGAIANPYSVELLYPDSPSLDPSHVAARVRSRCPQADVAAAAGGQPPIVFAHRDHVVTLHEGDVEAPSTTKVAAKTVVLPGSDAVDAPALHKALGQTRDWDGAVEAVARCGVQVGVADLFARDLTPRDRLALFQSVVLGLIEADPPAAIHWRPAGKVVDPAALLKASGSAAYDDLPGSAINVRLFRVKHATKAADATAAAASQGDLLMDTLGLAALMLPDLQIHFQGLEPARVASHLYACALYVLKNGDCLDDGEAIEGPRAGQTWTCRHAPSLASPPRAVIDLDPGPPYAGAYRGPA